MGEHTQTEVESDIRGEARLIDAVAAVKLALASRDLCGNAPRLLKMIDWILEREEPEPNNTVSTRVFIEAIKATK